MSLEGRRWINIGGLLHYEGARATEAEESRSPIILFRARSCGCWQQQPSRLNRRQKIGVDMAYHFLLGLALIAVIPTFPGNANAASAYTVRDGTTNMRSGPGRYYPVIAHLRNGRHVNVVGCLRDFSWCTVFVNRKRGWISGRRLEFMHAGRRVPLSTFYTFFNVPTIGRRQKPTSVQRQDECEACP